jgi:hypothetical protein
MSETYRNVSKIPQGLNYREIKSNLVLQLIQIFPPQFKNSKGEEFEFILNTRLIEKAMQFCKILIKNVTFNDHVPD